MNKLSNHLFALILLFSLLAGCSEKEISNPSNQPGIDEPGHSLNNEIDEKVNFKLPINFDSKGDNRIVSFFDDESLLYTTHYKDYSVVQTYHLISGEHQTLHTFQEAIGQVVVNEQLSTILVISYPTSYEAKFTYMNRMGEIIFEQSYEAFDFEIKWNPFNEEELLVTSFFEDWTFTSEVVNVKEKSSTIVQTNQPFMFWTGENELAYIDYMKDVWSITGDLVVTTINEEAKRIILTNVYYVDTSKDQIFAITMGDASSDIATYQILNSDYEVVASAQFEQLSSYADWYIPNYEFLGGNQFTIFKPNATGMLDEYESGFQLIIINGQEIKEIKEFQVPLPLKASPNGQFTLVGYDLEQLIDLKEHTIIDLFKK